MDTQELDLNFFLPDYADPDDLAYGEREDYDIVYQDDYGEEAQPYVDISDFDEAAEETNDSNQDSPDVPEVPNTISVISQTVRQGNNGAIVVDVVLNIEDVQGLTKYDFRVTKTS